MQQEKIDRISELSRIARSRELTTAEQAERARLREEYLSLVRGNLRATLEQIEIRESDGSITRLQEKNTKVNES